jgi:hypothetical protein
MTTLADFILLSSLFVGVVSPTILILFSLCRGNPKISSGEVETSGNGSSPRKDKEESSDVSSDEEYSSCPESKKILNDLRMSCNKLLDSFPLSNSERSELSSLIDSIILSPKFIQTIEKNKNKEEKVEDVSSLVLEATTGVFTPDEQMHIREKLDSLKNNFHS